MRLKYDNQQHRDFGSDLLSTVGGAVEGGVGSLIGSGMGLLMQGEQNANQVSQQQKLTNIQTQANEQLSDYNFANQLKMWQQTNYPAQVSQLEQAGLNPALLYGKGGGGGATTGSPSGGAGMGIAPNAAPQIQMAAAQSAETAADIKLKNAQADKIAAETPSGGAGTLGNATLQNIQTDTASLTQGIQNQQAQQAFTKVQTQLAQYNANIANVTQDKQIQMIEDTASQIKATMSSAEIQQTIDAKTMGDKIATIMYNMLQAYKQPQLTTAQTGQAQTQTQVNQQNAQLAAQYAKAATLNANAQTKNAQTAQDMKDLQIKIQTMDTGTQTIINSIMKGLGIVAMAL